MAHADSCEIYVADRESLDVFMEEMAVRIADCTPLMTEVGKQGVIEMRSRFDEQGSAVNGGWKELSKKYGAWKAEHFPGDTILKRSDPMASLSESISWNVLSPSAVEWGPVGIVYARVHDEGYKSIPQREYATPSEEFLDRVEMGIYNWLGNGSVSLDGDSSAVSAAA